MNADKTKVFLTKFFIFFICVYLRSSAANNSLGCPKMGFGSFGMAAAADEHGEFSGVLLAADEHG
jgi:hypothetical protein